MQADTLSTEPDWLGFLLLLTLLFQKLHYFYLFNIYRLHVNAKYYSRRCIYCVNKIYLKDFAVWCQIWTISDTSNYSFDEFIKKQPQSYDLKLVMSRSKTNGVGRRGDCFAYGEKSK